jgi:Holliday junction DNA helicase RuvA
MAILSVLPAPDAIRAIVFGDATMLTRANGVGKKSAERIILELSDKVSGVKGGAPAPAMQGKADDPKAEAIEALLGFGYSRSEAGAAVMGIDEEGLSPEEYVRLALKSMA